MGRGMFRCGGVDMDVSQKGKVETPISGRLGSAGFGVPPAQLKEKLLEIMGRIGFCDSLSSRDCNKFLECLRVNGAWGFRLLESEVLSSPRVGLNSRLVAAASAIIPCDVAEERKDDSICADAQLLRMSRACRDSDADSGPCNRLAAEP